jgi:microcystin-dependent protein
MKKTMVLVAALVLAATLAAAPAQFSYQGVLKGANNAPLTGTQRIELRLYDVASGGTALWGRQYAVQTDTNGLFNVEVSDNTGSDLSGVQYTSLDQALAKTDTIFIGLKVGSTSGEITPRQKMLPVPFAAVAANFSRANGNFTVAGQLTAQSATFSGSLTASLMTVKRSVSAESLSTKDATVTGNLTVSGTITGYGTVPVGGIIMWSGSRNNIPAGWVLCDGTDGTPNLCDRFIVGASGQYAVGATGGTNEVTLTEAQMPSHQHDYKFYGADNTGGWDSDNVFYDKTAHYKNNLNTRHTENTGGDQPHENRPPYYALCFIMRKN